MYNKPEIFLDKRTMLGEGPIWDMAKDRLCMVDVVKPSAIVGDTEKIVSAMIGTLFLTCDGKFCTAMGNGIYLEGETMMHESAAVGRFNDGKVGPDGWFYGGTNADDKMEVYGNFYSLSPDGELRVLFDRVKMSNGLDWSMDEKRLYYTDTGLQRIDVFDFDKDTHTLSGRRVLCELSSAMGIPDGLTIDTDDNLWVAMYNGGRVLKIDGRTGKLLGQIQMPTEKVTSCCFAGKNMDQLVITTSSFGQDAQYNPVAGYTFAVQTQETGRAPYLFG